MTDDGRADGMLEATGEGDLLSGFDVEALRNEVRRLRATIGPDEHDYITLKLEMWAARDLVVGLEAELGNVRGRCTVLDRELHIRNVELAKRSAPPTIDSTRPKRLRRISESAGKLMS
jgi:hypothetical protein